MPWPGNRRKRKTACLALSRGELRSRRVDTFIISPNECEGQMYLAENPPGSFGRGDAVTADSMRPQILEAECYWPADWAAAEAHVCAVAKSAGFVNMCRPMSRKSPRQNRARIRSSVTSMESHAAQVIAVWALGWSHFRFGVDLLSGDIDSLHIDSGEFEVDSRDNANQHSSASPRSRDHSLDAFQVAHDAANAPPDTNVNHTRLGISERTRQAIFPRCCHAMLQVPQQRPPSDEFRGPTEAGDLLDISILRWNKTLWSERACLHFS